MKYSDTQPVECMGNEMDNATALLRLKILKNVVRYGTKPVPLRDYLSLHRDALKLLPIADPVFQFMPFVHADATCLANPRLRVLLGTRPLGDSALSAASLNYLEEMVATHKPASILEFGSGVSTLALRLFLNERVGPEAPLFSVEQSRHYLEKTKVELAAVGLSQSVRFLHAPLRRAVVCGRRVEVYDLARLELLLNRISSSWTAPSGYLDPECTCYPPYPP
jgi:hypothetical protein